MARTVVMTGATGRIGAVVVRKLAALGMNVVMVTHNQKAAEELSSECREFPGQVVAMSNEAGDDAVFDDVFARFGSVDVLIPNHGGPDRMEDIQDVSIEEFEHKFGHQVLNTFKMVRRAVPFMEKGNFGRIILMSSQGAYDGDNSFPFMSSVVNGAVTSMMKSLAVKYEGTGITVNCIAKGHIEPDHLGPGETMPEGPFASAAEFANAVAFLANEESGAVTGQTIVVTK